MRRWAISFLLAIAMFTGCAPRLLAPQRSTEAGAPRAQLARPAILVREIAAKAEDAANVGPRVRQVVTQQLSDAIGSPVLDAVANPALKTVPRSELAQNGIQIIIEGTTSRRTASEMNSVFLQAVEAASGNVAVATAGRNRNIDLAAAEAANRLAAELVSRNLIKPGPLSEPRGFSEFTESPTRIR